MTNCGLAWPRSGARLRSSARLWQRIGQSGVVTIPLDASRINVALALERRRKGLLWYSTYVVDFAGALSAIPRPPG